MNLKNKLKEVFCKKQNTSFFNYFYLNGINKGIIVIVIQIKIITVQAGGPNGKVIASGVVALNGSETTILIIFQFQSAKIAL